MNQPMSLTREEKEQLDNTNTEKEWYAVCDALQIKRNGQYPPYLSREILELFQKKFPQLNKDVTK